MNSKIINRSIPPSAHAFAKTVLIRPEKTELSNGIKLFTLAAGGAELIRLELIFEHGMWDINSALVPQSAVRMIAEGTHKKTSAQLAAELDYYGSFFQASSLPDHAVLTFYTLRKYLESSLRIAKELIQEASYPQSELEIYRSNALQRLKIDHEKSGYLASHAFFESLFGSGHRYGHWEHEEDFKRLTREQLTDYHKLNFGKKFVIVLSGKVEEGDIALTEKILGTLTPNQPNQQDLVQPEAAGVKESFIPRKDAFQSSIRLGGLLFSKAHSDYPGMQVLLTLLGGYFGSRLMANLREEKGYTYGVSAGLSSLAGTGYFNIATDVDASHTEDALREIIKEISVLQNELVPQEEIRLVRSYLLGSFQSSIENAFSYADKFKAVHLYGLSYDYYDRYFDTVQGINSEQIRVLAQRYLKDDNFHTVIVGQR